MPVLRSEMEDLIRAQMSAINIMEGLESPRPRKGVTPPLRRRRTSKEEVRAQTRRVMQLSAVAVLCGTLCQIQVELLLSADADSGDLVSFVEYAYCAVVSSGALLRPRKLPWACHVQLFTAAVLYSALTNVGLSVRALPFATALVLKNGNIIANMLVGRLAGKRYSAQQLLAAAVISVGLVVTTIQRAAPPATPAVDAAIAGAVTGGDGAPGMPEEGAAAAGAAAGGALAGLTAADMAAADAELAGADVADVAAADVAVDVAVDVAAAGAVMAIDRVWDVSSYASPYAVGVICLGGAPPPLLPFAARVLWRGAARR